MYSDEVDFCKRLHDADWRVLYVPQARAVRHEVLPEGAVPQQRVVEMSRNRDRYMRKHHSPAAARAVRWLTAATYAVRALAAVVAPRPRRAPVRAPRPRDALAPAWRGAGRVHLEYNRGGRRL